jgi:hypothetical protein
MGAPGELGDPLRGLGDAVSPARKRSTETLSRRPPLATIAGLTAVVVCVALALVAYAFYPRAFDPAANWISDLGNTLLNPRGSIFFRADMVSVGVVLGAV